MNFTPFEIKKYIFYGFLTLFFVILSMGFYKLQITEKIQYAQKSTRNSVKVITRIPVRGNIYDRNGKLIVDNRPAFSLYLIPSETTDHTIQVISELTSVSPDEIREKLNEAGPFQSVKIVRQIDMKKLTWIQENILDLPGVEWKTEPKRNYVMDSGLAHLLGTLGEVDESELKITNELEPGDIVGKKAIERKYDTRLRGSKGFKLVKVDALGRIVEELDTDRNSIPEPGDQLYLSIDLRLQAFADTLMEGKRGAVVAIDPRNGEVLTFLSKPDYDLSYFTGVIQSDIWNELLKDPYHPLYDRACQSGYPPGSVFKLVAAAAALNEGVITPNWKVNCPGYFVLGRKTIRCWNPDGHGTLDLRGAIKNSCNVYFYKLGLKIGIDSWHKYSEIFHFGQRTGIELTNENPGLVPSREYYNDIYGENGWTRGMLANLAIGQGELLVTPLQMAQFTTIIANKGILNKPHLGLKLFDPMKANIKQINTETEILNQIDSTIYEVICEGMREVVNGGTGWRAGIYGIKVAGKTGTAQNPHGKDHAWFIGFAPMDDPEIAICVLVENGGGGGAVAAPIAGAYFKKYFYYQGKYDYAIERKLREIAAAKRDSLRADTLLNEITMDSISTSQNN